MLALSMRMEAVDLVWQRVLGFVAPSQSPTAASRAHLTETQLRSGSLYLRLRTYTAFSNTPSRPGAVGAHTRADTNVLWQRIGFPSASCGYVLVHAATRHISLQPHCSAGEQVSLPVAEVDGCPLGLGIIGPRGSDEDLLQLSASLMKLMRPVPSGDAAEQA